LKVNSYHAAEDRERWRVVVNCVAESGNHS